MINKKLFYKILPWLIFLLYISIGFYLSFNHEPWRDEAQSWLIVRDLSWRGLISQLPYEGTPPLWHFLVKPLADLGLPYFSQNILNFLNEKKG